VEVFSSPTHLTLAVIAICRSIVALWPVYGLLAPPLVLVLFLSFLFALILLSPIFG
jgi:hypothetical protein